MSTATSPDATPTVDGSLRASDAEREATVTRLHEALGEGRLDLAENETRVAAAYAARYRHELPPLLGDLPGARDHLPGTGAPTWAAIATSIVWRLRVVLGITGAAQHPPTDRHHRTAGLVVVLVLVLVWLLACAVAGALVA